MPAKKKAGKAKGRAKASAKQSAQAKPGKHSALQDGETLETMQGDVSMGPECPDGHRPRLWFDDLIACLSACNMQVPGLGDFESKEAKLFSTVLGYGLEFACSGSVTLKKKAFKEWSKAGRALLKISLACEG